MYHCPCQKSFEKWQTFNFWICTNEAIDYFNWITTEIIFGRLYENCSISIFFKRQRFSQKKNSKSERFSKTTVFGHRELKVFESGTLEKRDNELELITNNWEFDIIWLWIEIFEYFSLSRFASLNKNCLFYLKQSKEVNLKLLKNTPGFFVTKKCCFNQNYRKMYAQNTEYFWWKTGNFEKI